MKIASYYFLCLLVFLVSCEAIFESKPEISRENWITILNLDGTVDTYLQEGGGSCFFVPNPDEPDDEIALIVNHGKIFTMSLTGVHLNNLFEPDEGYEIDLRSTNLSHDKSKMVLKYGYNLYLIDIVDSSKIQLTFSYENIYGFPSFCLDDQKIIFSKIESDQRFLIEFDLETLTENVVMFNDEIVISRAKFITHDKIIGIAYNYINQEVGNLILYEVDSEEIHQISSDASDLFDINSFNGYCAYLNKLEDSLYFFNSNTLTSIGEIHFDYPVRNYPIFSFNGDKLILKNILIDTNSFQMTILEDVELISTWGNQYNLTFNNDTSKLIGVVKSDFVR